MKSERFFNDFHDHIDSPNFFLNVDDPQKWIAYKIKRENNILLFYEKDSLNSP